MCVKFDHCAVTLPMFRFLMKIMSTSQGSGVSIKS